MSKEESFKEFFNSDENPNETVGPGPWRAYFVM